MSYQDEDTPLHLAARQGHSQIVTLLIEAKAEIDARNSVSHVPVLHGRTGKLEPSFGYFHLHKTWAVESSQLRYHYRARNWTFVKDHFLVSS